MTSPEPSNGQVKLADDPLSSSGDGFSCGTYMCGIGASAGGLNALERFFHHVPESPGIAFIVIQHLSPHFPSHMDELLGRRTSLPIRQAENGTAVEPDTIYLIPPRMEVTVNWGRLDLIERDTEKFTLPIDRFFTSLAKDCGPRAIGVILSGTGADGTRGCREIHDSGGFVIVQSEDTAEFPSMPQSVIRAGLANLTLAPEEIPRAIQRHLEHPEEPETEAAPEDLTGIESIFHQLNRAYGIDFANYKPSTIGRRTQRRLALIGSENIDAYAERLAQDPVELNALYQDLLIGVTEFFRDDKPFEVLREEAVKLIKDLPEDRDLRAWSCGCASGEETYSLAITFLEAFREAGVEPRMKVFGTDAHHASLEVAGKGIFSEASTQRLEGPILHRYFKPVEEGWQIDSELRRYIVFAPHNILSDAPFTGMDVVCCRNLLIYLQPEAQHKALSMLQFSLRQNGLLMLGNSETTAGFDQDFEVVSKQQRILRKKSNAHQCLPPKIQLTSPLRRPEQYRPSGWQKRAQERNINETYDRLLARFMPPGVLVDHSYSLVHSFPGAERYLSLRAGRPTNNILQLVHAELRTSLSAALQQATRERAPVRYSDLEIANTDATGEDNSQSEATLVTLTVEPMTARSFDQMDFMVLFSARPLHQRHSKEQTVESEPSAPRDVGSQEQVAVLEQELTQAKENLQATIEELETSNEELQATNEELTASNEELQSSNEELHSVNEELYTVNSEYQRKITELAEVSSDLQVLLRSSRVGVIFLDEELRVRRFTPKVTEVFPLTESDQGRPINAFSHKLAYRNFFEHIQQVHDGSEPVEREVMDHSGHHFLVRILKADESGGIEGIVITIISIDSLKSAETAVRRLSAIVENSHDAIAGTDMEGRVETWNRGAERLYGYTAEEAKGQSIFKLIVPRSRSEELKQLQQRVRSGEAVQAFTTERLDKYGQTIIVSLMLSPIMEGERIVGISAIDRDITKQEQTVQALRRSEQRQSRLVEVLTSVFNNLQDMVYIVNPNLQLEFCSPSARAFLEHFPREPLPLGLAEEVNHVIDTGESFLPTNFKERREFNGADDESRVFLPRISPIRNELGTITGATLLLQDITEFKLLDEMKTNMIGTVSHELKTPTTSVRLSLSMLAEQDAFGPLTPEQLELVNTARREIDRLLRNLNILLDLTRYDEGFAQLTKSEVDPGELMEDALKEIAAHSSPQNMQFEKAIDASLPTITIDRNRLQHVLVNLLTNAIKYSPPNGVVGVHVTRRDNVVRFEVSDQGPGVPEEYRDAVFNRFFRVPSRKTKPGSGLGLSIVREFVNAHGGNHGVVDNPGGGSCFFIEIPLTAAETKAPNA
ncbi:MAG: chemotaxis protein CheB [Opitutales bacterium]